MKKLISILALAASALTAVAQWGPQSRVVTDTIHSAALGADRAVTVYLPRSFDTDRDRTYPVLYLLHGMYGDHRSWVDHMRAKDVIDRLTASGEADEMVVVTPNAGGADAMKEQNGYFNIPGWSYEDFFFNELVPAVEKKYRAGGSKGRRAIAGLSMGGGGATSYAQRHADMFGSAYAMSALMDLPEPQQPEEDNKVTRLMKSARENSCVRYVKEADQNRKNDLRTVKWFVDCGDDDFLLDSNIEFMRAMREAGIPMQFRVRDGAHNSEYWHSALELCLPFVSGNFDR